MNNDGEAQAVQAPYPEARVTHLNQQLQMSERQLNILRAKNRQLDAQIIGASTQNKKLVSLLHEAKDEILALQNALGKEAVTPFTFATVTRVNLGISDAGTAPSVDVIQSGRKLRVGVSPLVDAEQIKLGDDVLLNESLSVVAVLGRERVGELATLKEVLPGGRVLAVGRSEDQRVFQVDSDVLAELRVGDAILVDVRSGNVLEKIPRSNVEELVLEEVPEVSYADIGGLSQQIEQIKDAVELPFLHPDLYREHGLSAPKGILLYGPPGCGKTLIAKAVARSLAEHGSGAGEDSRAYFLNIKGPELLDKYVGETERQIRLIFARAREKAQSGAPVVVFFDEMDSLFRTRGTGISSDVETTIVPQLLSEIDGVESLDNVIVIGASNREDMIDPAILRPGRLDVKIKIQRPNSVGAAEIFAKYLTAQVPLHASELAEHGGDREQAISSMIQRGVERMFSTDELNEFLELTYEDGSTEVLYFRDFISGAVIRNVVDRAKKNAVKDFLRSRERGVKSSHLMAAITEEFAEQTDMPGVSSPDEWARISGRKGQRIKAIRVLGSPVNA